MYIYFQVTYIYIYLIEDADIEKLYQLGRWQEDKPRPLLIAFHNNEKKDYIMANLRNLKYSVDKFKKIGISHDLPPKEREENKRTVEEAKLAHDTQGNDTAENYKFLVVGHGNRKKVITVKKQMRIWLVQKMQINNIDTAVVLGAYGS